jgi:hypothetical protein
MSIAGFPAGRAVGGIDRGVAAGAMPGEAFAPLEHGTVGGEDLRSEERA